MAKTENAVAKIETNVGLVSKAKCPYRMCRTDNILPLSMYEERFDFQIEENGKIGRVSLGTFDLVKEVNSHNGEVGLINVIKLAEARGVDIGIFGKTEPGLMVDVSGIDTVDDLIQAQADNQAKLQEFADTLGISVDELVNAVKSGDTSILTPKAEEKKEGEE